MKLEYETFEKINKECKEYVKSKANDWDVCDGCPNGKLCDALFHLADSLYDSTPEGWDMKYLKKSLKELEDAGC